MLSLKVTRIDQGGLGVALPEHVLQELGLREGDTVFLEDTPKGAILVACDTSGISVDPAVVEQLSAGHEFMRDYHRTFRLLTK